MTHRVPLAGVIGASVAYSKSPLVHGHWLRRYGLPGYYIPMNVASDDLESALSHLPTLGFVGVNVTIPHKEQALDLADSVTDQAARIGAANTLTFRDGKILADNTDGYGFLTNLRTGAPDWDPTSGPAAVLGAGGAARAIITSLIGVGVPEIHLSNRTRTRAETLRSEFGDKVLVREWVQAGNMIDGAATVVNTTSLGMTGHPELRVPLDGLSSDAVVTDLIYAPLETRLLREAREIGCRTVDGLGMLLHQAAPGFERWFGHRPEVDDDLRQAVLA